MRLMVYEFLADGFEEIEALTTVDILRRAKIEIQTVSIAAEKNVVGAHGIKVEADITADEMDLDALDMVILPGGLPGALNLQASSVVKATLAYACAHHKFMAAICAAPSVLAGYGYLEGRHAVCNPGFEDKMPGAVLEHSAVSIDQNIITSRAAGTAHHFAFALLQALGTDPSALRKDMLYE